MEPKDTIDDTAYFKAMRAQENDGGPTPIPFDGRVGGTSKWSIEPDATREDDHWIASVSIVRMGEDATTEDGQFDQFFTLTDHYPDEVEALCAARDYGLDWVAQQPVQ